jgi:hypothetical protein
LLRKLFRALHGLSTTSGVIPLVAALVRRQATELAARSRADLDVVEIGTEGVLDALRQSPVRLSTMGRGLEEALAAFLLSAVAGVVAIGARLWSIAAELALAGVALLLRDGRSPRTEAGAASGGPAHGLRDGR